MVPPISTPKWSFLVGKPMVVGETHHFRRPQYIRVVTYLPNLLLTSRKTSLRRGIVSVVFRPRSRRLIFLPALKGVYFSWFPRKLLSRWWRRCQNQVTLSNYFVLYIYIYLSISWRDTWIKRIKLFGIMLVLLFILLLVYPTCRHYHSTISIAEYVQTVYPLRIQTPP